LIGEEEKYHDDKVKIKERQHNFRIIQLIARNKRRNLPVPRTNTFVIIVHHPT